MKKKLLLYCVAAMLLMQSVAGASSFEKVEFSPASKTLSVSGKADKNADAADQTATIRVLKPGVSAEDLKELSAEEVKNALVFLQQKSLDASGKFAFTYRPQAVEPGNYNIYITNPNGSVLYQYVMFLDADQNATLMSDLRGGTTKASMLTALEDNSYLLEGIADYEKVCEELGEETVLDSIAGMIAGMSFSDANDAVKKALSAMVTTMVNYAEDKQEIVSLLEQYKQSIGLDSNKIYTELFLSDASDEKILKRAEEIAKNFLNQDYESTDTFVTDFCDTVIIERLNADINYTAVMDILYAAEDYLTGFSFEKYEKLTGTQKAYVQQKVADGGNYSSVDAIKAIFNTAVTDAPKQKQNNNGGGGGGGGSYSDSSSGSGIGVPKVTTGNQNAAPIGSNEVFNDLSDVLWAKDAILELHKKGIVNGIGNKQFNPQGQVTREQFATMLINAYGLLDSNAVCSFADVTPGAWYEKYIASAVAKGIVYGQNDSYFGTGSQISREDMAVMALRAAEQYAGLASTAPDASFADDIDIAEYAKTAVYTLKANGVLNGKGENKFEPKAFATRAEAAKIIYSLIQLGGSI